MVPKPAYLVAGELDVLEGSFTTMTGREVALKVYVDPGMAPRAAYALDSLQRAIKWDEDTCGREYDLDPFMIVAVRDFNFGAMENKGLNIFNSSLLLADQATATDMDYEGIESVVAHEYFHNWTGNRITCRDWFQLCLKEGFTVFRDQCFSADMRAQASASEVEEGPRARRKQAPGRQEIECRRLEPPVSQDAHDWAVLAPFCRDQRVQGGDAQPFAAEPAQHDQIVDADPAVKWDVEALAVPVQLGDPTHVRQRQALVTRQIRWTPRFAVTLQIVGRGV